MLKEPAPTGANDGGGGYTAVQAARIAGLTTRRLAYLAEQDLVAPSLIRPGGRRRYYSFADLIELRTINRLTAGENRISTRRVRKVVEALREIHDRPLVTCTLAVCDGQVLWADEQTRTLIDVLQGFQTVLVVNLGYVETDVRRALAHEGLALPHQRTAEPLAA
jgi:DNA-binding transcriptional MerR regulator